MRELQRALDQVAAELGRAAKDAQRNWRNWREAEGCGPNARARIDLGSAAGKARDLPGRIQDIASEGSHAMRYFFGYCCKGFAILHASGGFGIIVFAVLTTLGGVRQFTSSGFLAPFSGGLCMVIIAQMIWWAGRLLHRSADRKQYAHLQGRLLKLARTKGGNLTVLEAATDGKMTVEKAEEILREQGQSTSVNSRTLDFREGDMKAPRTTIDSTIRDDIATLKVTGDTTARDRIGALHEVVAHLIQRGAKTVVVDLSTASWLGAAMLGELVAAQTVVKRAGARMRLAGLPRRANRILSATRLDTVFEMAGPQRPVSQSA